MPELKVDIHDELGEIQISEGKHGPNILKAQIINYEGKRGPGDPGLNLQSFWTNEDGELQFGKRPLLNKKMLEWIKDNDIINKAIEALG